MKQFGSKVRTAFDEAYYNRFYGDPETKAQDRRTLRRLSALIFAYLEYLDIRVRRVLDLGCGLGAWRTHVEKRYPRAQYTGVEASEYLRTKYGWEAGTAATYRDTGRYDLIICQGVLQYVDDDEFRASIANIARLCRGALFLEIPTVRDWDENCDRELTDGEVHLRTGDWYRREIEHYFRSIGAGLWLPRDSEVVLFELEGGS